MKVMTKTNFTLIKELNEKYQPKTRGIVSSDEVTLIKDALELHDATELELRNMRDFVVIFFDNQDAGDRTSWNKMSAITHVIDILLSQKGCAV
jgi:hypothetical protein